jgi:adenylate kinase family enzyme
MERVLVLGECGSGKSTVARRLGAGGALGGERRHLASASTGTMLRY